MSCIYLADTYVSILPRGCGVRGIVSIKDYNFAGSSPRVRGTRSVSCALCACFRFIPAGAGNTSSDRWKIRSTTVHPRGCGEHKEHEMYELYDTGSSPRVRGTRASATIRRVLYRFIPEGEIGRAAGREREGG